MHHDSYNSMLSAATTQFSQTSSNNSEVFFTEESA